MLLKLCRLIDLHMTERWTATCRDLASSKCPSELFCLPGAHAPFFILMLIIALDRQTGD